VHPYLYNSLHFFTHAVFLFVQAFEQTLKTRYECMVDALHEKVKAEQEARMQRAIDNLEVSCGNSPLLPLWAVLS
jgi:hypothetical protein